MEGQDLEVSSVKRVVVHSITEKDGLLSGRPVLIDLPLSSRMRCFSHCEVEPMYVPSLTGRTCKKEDHI